MNAPGRGASLDRRIAIAVAAWALALVALAVAPPSLRDGSPRPSLLGDGAWGALADNAARVQYDDGYYYLVIARRVARGEGPTFDGLHRTSGYHPLWLLLLVPLAALLPEPPALLLAALALQAVLLAGSAVLAYRTWRRHVCVLPALLGTALWLQFAGVHGAAVSGVEWALHAFLLTLTASLWGAAAPATAGAVRGRHPEVALGAVLALLFLARVDTLPLAACLAAALALRGADLRRLAALAAPVVLAVAAYALVNVQLTGRAAPISAAVKREWSDERLRHDPRFRDAGLVAAKFGQLAWPLEHQRRAFWLHLAAGTVGFGAVLAGAAWRRRRRPALGAPGAETAARLTTWTPFAAFAVLHWLALALVYHDGYSYAPWYFTVQPWLAALLAAALAQRALDLCGGRLRWPRAAVALTLAAAAAFTVADLLRARAQRRAEGEEPLYAVAREVRARVPPEARVGAWNAGQIAFLSGRTVINLDGLVHSWDFFERRRHGLCAYLQAERIEYLADSFPAQGAGAWLGDAAPACDGALRELWSQPSGTPRARRLGAIYVISPPDGPAL